MIYDTEACANHKVTCILTNTALNFAFLSTPLLKRLQKVLLSKSNVNVGAYTTAFKVAYVKKKKRGCG